MVVVSQSGTFWGEFFQVYSTDVFSFKGNFFPIVFCLSICLTVTNRVCEIT